MSSEKTKEMDEKSTSEEVKNETDSAEQNSIQNDSEVQNDNQKDKTKSSKDGSNEDQDLKSKIQDDKKSSENSDDEQVQNEKEVRISELEEELKTVKDSLLRKAAELENVRKRVQRERLQLFEEAKAIAMEDFMPISDDLLRTLKAAEESKVEDSFLDGVKMVNKKFQDVFEKHGVERIDEVNVPFDINLHDAMMKQPASDDKTKSNIVLQVLESGYKIGNRTVKHAKVIVSE